MRLSLNFLDLLEREKSLAFEAIAAILAADLGLPIPEPFIVKLEQEFINIIPDSEIQKIIKKIEI